MNGYIDIHSHILPQLDDGSQSIEQTVNMLNIAYAEGIRTIITTPHYKEGLLTNLMQKQQEYWDQLKETLKTTMPDMTILIGSEIYYSHESVKLLRQKYIPTMAGSKYVLIEFPSMVEYRYIKSALQELLFEGYRPILAHVERYRNLSTDSISEFIDMGVYSQVNASSLSPKIGNTYLSIAKKLVKKNLVHFIATDSHNDGNRAPKLKKCIEYIVKKYGESYVNELLIDNPSKLLNNCYIPSNK
jgi:protein-tyrosine phosphatase